jgi:hypothetical protein
VRASIEMKNAADVELAATVAPEGKGADDSPRPIPDECKARKDGRETADMADWPSSFAVRAADAMEPTTVGVVSFSSSGCKKRKNRHPKLRRRNARRRGEQESAPEQTADAVVVTARQEWSTDASNASPEDPHACGTKRLKTVATSDSPSTIIAIEAVASKDARPEISRATCEAEHCMPPRSSQKLPVDVTRTTMLDGNAEYHGALEFYKASFRTNGEKQRELILDHFLTRFDFQHLVKNKWSTMDANVARDVIEKELQKEGEAGVSGTVRRQATGSHSGLEVESVASQRAYVQQKTPDASSKADGSLGDSRHTPERASPAGNSSVSRNLRMRSAKMATNPDVVARKNVNRRDKARRLLSPRKSAHPSSPKLVVDCSRRTMLPGNKEYNDLLDLYGPRYTRGNQSYKTTILDHFLQSFDFQQLQGKNWISLDTDQARESLISALRNEAHSPAKHSPLRSSAVRNAKESEPSRRGSEENRNRQARSRATKLPGSPEIDGTSPIPKPAIDRRRERSSGIDEHVPKKVGGMRIFIDNAALKGKAVVFCGNGFKNKPGNVEYAASILADQDLFLTSTDVERTAMIDSMMKRFEFRRFGDGAWKLADELWAKEKVRKAFVEMQRRGVPREKDHEQPDRHARPIESDNLHRFTACDATYIEELSFHYYAGLDPTECVRDPLPPPGPAPDCPKDDSQVVWTYDESSRVYLGDFSKVQFVPEHHKRFLGELMERDDITVICEGLLGEIQDGQDFLNAVARSFRNDPHHKFRRFEKREMKGTMMYQEVDGYVTMTVASFISYLDMLHGDRETPPSFVVYDHRGRPETITSKEASRYVFYMIDVDMPKTLVHIYEDYKRNFKMKEILPSGAWCMLNHVRIVETVHLGGSITIG